MEAPERPDWLPDGWGWEIRTRKNGIKDRYYTTPEGQTFRSKVQALRYLTGDGHTPKSATSLRESKNYFEGEVEDFPQGLPDEWMVEIRTKMTGKTAGKKYKYFIDPVSGYLFRSLKDAFRYIETGVIPKRACRLKENYLSDMYSLGKEALLPVAARETKLRGTAARRCLFSGQEPLTYVEGIKIDSSPENPKLLMPNNASGVDGNISSNMTSFDGEHEDEKLFDHEIKLLTWPMIGNPAETSENENPSSRGNLESSNLEDIEVELKNETHFQPVSENSVEPRRARGRPRKRGRRNRIDPLKPKPKLTKQVKTRSLKAITMPLRASKRLAGFKPDYGAESFIPERSRREVAKNTDQLRPNPTHPDSNSRFSWTYESSNQLKTAPVVDPELPEQLETKKQTEKLAGTCKWSEDKLKSPLTSPFGDSWPDPCLEFAFKTLTGDLPPLEDSVALQKYFHQQLISVQSSSTSSLASLIFGSSSK